MHRRRLCALTIALLMAIAGCAREDKKPTEPRIPEPSPVIEQEVEAPAEEQVTAAPESEATSDQEASGEKPEPVEYEVMSGERGDKDLSYGEYHSENVDVTAAKRYSRDIIVPRDTTDEEIAATLRRALDDFRTEHPSADALSVSVSFEGSTGMRYASLYWAADGGRAFGEESGSIDWNRHLRPPELEEGERFGLSLVERKQLFIELAAAEGRAMDEAMAKHPDDFDRQIDVQRELTAKYKKHVREQYDITQEQQDAIELEGGEQFWPM